ncbi:MAG: hypothetical protein JWM04_1388 [Verrucomicrobiales bacterium]|nr:hypothetical protein [Verrucomicrobiales bacterium]
MRFFNLFSAWTGWVLCACYTGGSLYLRLLNSAPASSPSNTSAIYYARYCWFLVALFTCSAAGAYVFRKFIWFEKRKPAGMGFWAVTCILNLSIICLVSLAFASYLAGNDRGPLSWIGIILGVVFLIISFPRLPKTGDVVPPPLPL